VRLLREAKSRGLAVTAEVTPHHLMLTDESLVGYDTACKVNPPLREPEDREALRQALRDGTIDCIATDHAPHSVLEKDCELAVAAPGMIGLDTALASLLELVRDGTLTATRLVEALSTSPSKVARLDGGTLKVGARADVVVIDPETPWKVEPAALRSKSHNTPLLGKTLHGRVRTTIASGKVVHE